jgi:hypothetical protein
MLPRLFLKLFRKLNLHSWDPEAPEQLICHAIDDFPKTLAELKAYFKQARPLPKGGKILVKILASYQGDFKAISSQVSTRTGMNSFNTRSFKKLTLPLLDGYSTARGIGMGILCQRCSLPNSTVRLP